MKIKTHALLGPALDWAVAMCEGFLCDFKYNGSLVRYSTDWKHGGPIIEREEIALRAEGMSKENAWFASTRSSLGEYGPTPLIATMRCYVASRLGDEVEVPEGLQA